MKKYLLLLCLTLLTLPAICYGDSISFLFFDGPNTPPVNINASGVNLTSGLNIAVVDTTTHSLFFIPGNVNISTGAASSYVETSNFLLAQFSPGTGVEVEVDSAFCGGVCIQGTSNTTGTYAATLGSTGSFQALFKVSFVSASITSLFGLPNTWQQIGSDGFTTSDNLFTKGGTTDLAILGGGAITFQTPVPEPSTLGLLAAGFVTLTTFTKIRMKGN